MLASRFQWTSLVERCHSFEKIISKMGFVVDDYYERYFLVVLFLSEGIWPHPLACTCRLACSPLTVGAGYSMPFLNIWLAAMSMTLMMNAMAKAQMRLFLTHVWRFFFEGWTERETRRGQNKTVPQRWDNTNRGCTRTEHIVQCLVLLVNAMQTK